MVNRPTSSPPPGSFSEMQYLCFTPEPLNPDLHHCRECRAGHVHTEIGRALITESLVQGSITRYSISPGLPADERGHEMSGSFQLSPDVSDLLTNHWAVSLHQVPYKVLRASFKHSPYPCVLFHAQETDDRAALLNRIFCNVLYLYMGASSHIWILSIWNVAGTTEMLHF